MSAEPGSATGRRRLDAAGIAAALRQANPPTDEQARVIEYASGLPALVVAGAGSGKTHTMALRVVWLVATGRAAPSEILGLTFTRKATGELAQRVRSALGRLRQSGLLVGGAGDGLLDAPTISTYNAFANRLFQENALRVGYEPDSTLLTEAGAWQLAHDIVVNASDEGLAELDRSPSNVTDLVLSLAHAMTDHLVDPEALQRFPQEFAALGRLPGRAPTARLRDAIGSVGALEKLVPLAVRFIQRKRDRGLIEYADQVALALRALRAAPSAVAEYRRSFRYVLLDEYQDTSVSQTRLLATLFHDHPVMAVGDPNQSIYGWRGAAAANLARFPRDFLRAPGPEESAGRFTLSTSWRNAAGILDLANTVARGLARPPDDGDDPVVTLRPAPAAERGGVEYYETATIDEEAQLVAQLVGDELSDGGARREIALLFRTRKHIGIFADALRARGIRHQVVGLGGVLESPEVTDLLSALAVVASANAGNQLIRLLTGPIWNLGARDVAALAGHAALLARRERAAASGSGDGVGAQGPGVDHESVAVDDAVTVVDALDHLGTLRQESGYFAPFSPSGAERIRAAAAVLRRLRRLAGRPLREFVRIVEQQLLLDIEVVANPRNAVPRRDLDAFHAKVAEFEATVPGASLGGLVSWFERVRAEENLSADQEPPEPGTVQLLTIHAAKGLEWDSVFLPRFVAGEYPAANRGGADWLRVGAVPAEFRGDGADLPEFRWRGLADTSDLADAYARYMADHEAFRLDEERRVFYVAATRPRHRLVCTAGFSAPNRRRVSERSAYLPEIRPLLTGGSELSDEEYAALASAPNAEGGGRTQQWPSPSAQAIVPSLAALAEQVENAPERPDTGAYAADIDLLLAERTERLAESRLYALPDVIAASHIASFLDDPQAKLLDTVRPVPSPPSPLANLGTAFHRWVEEYFAMRGQRDTLDFDAVETDGEALDRAADGEPERLHVLTETFLSSEWASRRPVDVELSITALIGTRRVPCKLDAVFQQEDGRIEIVDWKTGAAPRTESGRVSRAVQLAIYRHAYAQWARIDPDQIDVAFYYVADDLTVRPERVLDSDQLIDALAGLDGPRSLDDGPGL